MTHEPRASAEHQDLFRPLQLAGVRIPNRVMTSAMTLQYGEGGLISDRHLAFYAERATGGAGLLFSEQLTATPISGSPFGSAIHAYDDRQVARFAALAEVLDPYPTRFFAQLFAGGAVGSSTVGLDDWMPVRAPSRIGIPGGETPLPLTGDDLVAIAADFAASAANVRAGGLDGVEVHGSHGWLVGQFLSPFYNRREDEYGGPVENRCRLAIEIGTAIRAAVGPDFPLGLSLSYDEFIGDAGITPADTLAQLEVFVRAGVYDFFDISVGSSHSEHFTIAPMSVDEGFTLEFAARAKRVVGDRAALFIAGRIVSPAMAVRAIRDGAADMVAMSRAHLADPHLVNKTRTGRTDEITRCIGANVCVGRALRGEPVACVLTPATGRESEWGELTVAPARRRVVVVGGGPAGLRAGAVAAARGHEVVVHERRDEPGGHLARMAWLPTRAGWGTAVEDLVSTLARNGGVLESGSEVDAARLERERPDVVLVATGSSWDTSGQSAQRPESPGLARGDKDSVLGLDTALDIARSDPAGLGRRVVIADETGTYAPLGLAEVLAAAGAEVEVVTPNSEIAHEATGSLESPHLLPRLRRLGVTLRSGYAVAAIESSVVRLADAWGGEDIEVDGVSTLVLAMGRVPADGLFHELHGRLPEVHCIGDALSPRPTEAVIHEAERWARTL
jgi:2,4-dienoyl-CoA reductase-like NADH-dependent reductase (Old Yellow Enzyme family)